MLDNTPWLLNKANMPIFGASKRGFDLQVKPYYNQTKPILKKIQGANERAKRFDWGGATNAVIDTA